MKATKTEAPFEGEGWIFEVKWDGYRIIAEKEGNKVTLFSRNQKVFNERFPQIVSGLKKIPNDFIIDGEAVIFDSSGKPSFGLMQNKANSQKATLVVFDILKIDERTITNLALENRKEILEDLIPKLENIELADHVNCDGIHFFEQIKKQNLEGIIAKKLGSTYEPGKRSKNWLKIKNINEEEVLIIGFTQSEKGGAFGALLLGQYDNENNLVYQGKVGTGFSISEAKKLKARMEKLRVARLKVMGLPEKYQNNLIKPVLVAEITYTEKIREGSYRHPSFIGLREDKSPKEVTPEKVIPPPTVQSGESEIINIEGQKIKISNPSKIFWTKNKVTKKDLINFYIKAAPYILPFLNSRPESLHRFPDGAGTKGFFQKNYNLPAPRYIKTKEFYSKSNNRNTKFIICNNAATLIFIVNLGCIEINPWSSTITKPNRPTWLIIDLDPEDISFDAVIKTAQAAQKVFKKYKINAFLKTSGATGIHIYIPMANKYTYKTVKEFAHFLASEIHKLVPEITSLERLPKKRKNKVYIDYLQNNYGATVAAPFSVRPQNTPNVSMPLSWEELKPGLKPENFTIFNSVERLPQAFKLFEPILQQETNIDNVISGLNFG